MDYNYYDVRFLNMQKVILVHLPSSTNVLGERKEDGKILAPCKLLSLGGS